MATDYSMNLKAKLDTSDVQQKLQQLGQTGETATSQLEQSVKKLEGAIKDLMESWKTASKEAQQTGLQMQKLLRGGSAMLVGGVINRLGNYAAATGNQTGATAASYAGNMLKGAGAGAAMGNAIPVVGTAIGAAIGAAAGALETLADSATKAAEALNDAFAKSTTNLAKKIGEQELQNKIGSLSGMDPRALTEERKNQQFWIDEYPKQVEKARKQLLELGVGEQSFSYGPGGGYMLDETSLTDEQKKAVVKLGEELDRFKGKAQDAAKVIAEIDQKLEQNRKIEEARIQAIADKAKAEDQEAKAMRDALNAAEEKAKADEEVAQKSMAEAAAKAQAEFLKISGQAGSSLDSFQKDRRLEEFGKSLENMTPAELMSLRDSLSGQKAAAAAQVESLFGAAKQSGQSTDLEAAQNALVAFNEIAKMFDMTEMGLGGLTTPSIQQQMQALGSDAMKGYDTAGYGSLERDMYNVEKETQNNTKDAASSLSAIKSNINEIKNMMTQNSNKSVWG